MSTPTHTSTYPLWKHMHDEHKLFLTESELGEIIDAAERCQVAEANVRLTKLVDRWRKAANTYGRQVEEARTRGTPHDQMLSGLTFLRQCANDLEGEIQKEARR